MTFAVAVVELARDVAAEAAELAGNLGVTAYDAGLLLRAGSPAIVLRTPDKQRALDLLASLRGRGHEAVACDVAAVTRTAEMTAVGRPSFDATSFAGVPYADVFAILRATVHSQTVTVEKTKERQFSLGRAALTGGLLMTKGVTKESTATTDEREPTCWIFRRGAGPCVLRATHARYDDLGAERRPTQLENFLRTVELLRERAPHATYDERLLSVRADPEKLDLLVHLLALALARRARHG